MKRYLMTPGPTPVPPAVLESQARPMIHHRTPEFCETVRSCVSGLKEVLHTENDVIILASSGTGAMESSIANCFCAGDTVIVCYNGKFGERMAKISEAYGLNVVELSYDWREVVDPADVERALAEHSDARGVILTQSETSSGVLNDVAAVGAVVADHEDCIFIVDSITGVGAVELRTDDWNVDVVMTGSQKGLMLPPGLAAVAISEKAWRACERATLPRFYFDWRRYRKSLDADTTPFTPAVSLMHGLQVALDIILEEGIEEVVARHDLLARATRAGVEALGFELFAPVEGRGSAVTTVLAPEGVDSGKLVKIMKDDYGVTIAGGQDSYKGKIFRIGHLGYIGEFDIITTLAALEMALTDLGVDVESGKGIAAAEQVFMEARKNG